MKKLFILSGFETQSYSTHTMFYATSMEKVHPLLLAFTEWLIKNNHLLYDDSEDGLIVSAFSNALYHARKDEKNEKVIIKSKLYTELLGYVREVELDKILFDESQVDGD